MSVSGNIEVETYTKVTLYNVKSASDVIIYGNGQLLLKGSTVIEGGELKPLDADAKIIVAGPLSASTVATITPSAYTAGAQLIEVAEGAGVSMSAVYKKFKVKADGTTEWQLNSSGQLEKKPIGTKSAPSAIGDIVFSDGTAIAYTAGMTLTSNQKANAIAVIYKTGATSYGVGLHNTYEYYDEHDPELWLRDFAESSSWASSYGSKYSLSDDYKTGWTRPTKDDAVEICNSLSIVNSALNIAGGFELATNYEYWTSTKVDDDHYYAIKFSNGEPRSYSDQNAGCVFAIREF